MILLSIANEIIRIKSDIAEQNRLIELIYGYIGEQPKSYENTPLNINTLLLQDLSKYFSVHQIAKLDISKLDESILS